MGLRLGVVPAAVVAHNTLDLLSTHLQDVSAHGVSWYRIQSTFEIPVKLGC